MAELPPRQTTGWTEARFWPILAGLCLLALLGRLAILSEYVGENTLAATPVNDAKTYWQWAQRVADGQLIQEAPFFSAPLYPYLLGLLRALGGSLAAVYALQMLADLATGCLIAQVCRSRFGATAALLATLLFFLLQEPASMSLRILASSLHLILVTITWAVLVRVQAKPSVGRLITAGVTLGLLCLAYAPALMLIGLATGWLLCQTVRRVADIRRAVLFVSTAALLILPATLHNWRVSGELFLVQAVSGITLRLGNNPNANGAYTPIPGISGFRDHMHADAARVYRQATGDEPNWKKVDKYFRSLVFQDWRADPLRAIKLAAFKLYCFLSFRNYGDIYEPNAEIAYGLNRWLRLAPVQVPWLIGPALLGLVLMLRRPIHHAPEWLLVAVPLFAVVVFWYSPRFRIPAVPIIVVSAGWTIERALHWRVHWRQTIAVTVLCAAGALLGPLHRAAGLDLPNPTKPLRSLALAHAVHGDVEAAIENLRASLKIKPDDCGTRILLGDLLSDHGRLAEALAEYRHARTFTPDDAELLGRIGQTLYRQRRFDEAHEVLTRALEKRPAHPLLLNLLAATLQVQGRTTRAIEAYEEALKHAPGETRIRAAYADLLARLERWDDARTQYAHIVQMQPANAGAHYRLGVIAERLGRFGEAAAHFRQALAIDPAHAGARGALQRIELLRPGPSGINP